MGDHRLKILTEARNILEKEGGSQSEKESLLKLLDILTASLEKFFPENNNTVENVARELINNRLLLAILKQQTDELDALKKLSINLTSSLDLPDVLDAVVSEAMRLIENARDVNIFLYKNHKLSFGAALDADGTRNRPWSKPRSNGLTNTVAREDQMISRQAYSDTLTGLPNRRALDERLEEEVSSARRNNYSFAVIMMDLDGFKLVNDTYGHSVGDDVLRLVFNQMARGVRTTDFLARYGGDELTLILSQTELSSAQIVCEKITEGMKKLKFRLPDGRRLKLSISGGIALFPVHARTGPDLLRAADAALYQAKK